jgi:hypothetical protein
MMTRLLSHGLMPRLRMVELMLLGCRLGPGHRLLARMHSIRPASGVSGRELWILAHGIPSLFK